MRYIGTFGGLSSIDDSFLLGVPYVLRPFWYHLEAKDGAANPACAKEPCARCTAGLGRFHEALFNALQRGRGTSDSNAARKPSSPGVQDREQDVYRP